MSPGIPEQPVVLVNVLKVEVATAGTRRRLGNKE